MRPKTLLALMALVLGWTSSVAGPTRFELTLLAAEPAAAMTPSYLSEMPSVERVMREVKGLDPGDTTARQVGTFWQLSKIIEDMAWGLEHRYRNRLTADENRLRGEYQDAFNKMRPSIPDRSFKGLRGYDDDPKYTAVLLNQFFSQGFRDLYYKANGVEMARLKAAAQPQVNIFGAPQAPGQARSPADMQGDIKSLTKGLNALLGVNTPTGLRMNGRYQAEGFGMGFSAESAYFMCGDLVPEGQSYTVERSEHQVTISVDNDPKPIVVELRPDGKLAGPGAVVINGKIQVGTKKVWINDPTVTGQDGYGRAGYWSTVPVYQPKTMRCTAGLLAPTGANGTQGGAVHASMSVLGLGAAAPTFKITPGLRINGNYVGQGSSIEFDEDSATITCGGNQSENAYAIAPSGGEELIKIDSTNAVLAVELDGRLTVREGTGCVFGTLSLSGTPAPCVASPGRGGGPGAGNVVAGGSAAVLALVSGLTAPSGGQNLLQGHTFALGRESFDVLLTKIGFHPPADTSVLGGWAQACRNRMPVCQQGFNAVGAASISTVSLDASGRAVFAAVPPGTYYVFGVARFGDGHMLWNVRVDLVPDGQTLVLNQRNAMPID